MPLFDFKCPECGTIKELHFESFDQAKRCHMWCTVCMAHEPMERQPSAASFEIKGYSAKNGYSEGQ